MIPFHPKRRIPRARQVLVVWLAAWPTLTLVMFLISPFTALWPIPAKALASVTAMAPIMNLGSIPLLKAAHRRVSRARSNWIRW